jgi:hypothetical protein
MVQLRTVKIGKRSVSFHLFPIYVHPNLVDGMSPELRKRTHGKSCFNFIEIDPALMVELERLPPAGFARCQEDDAILVGFALYASTRRKIVEAFWPPKPKPFTIAARTDTRRATSGT